MRVVLAVILLILSVSFTEQAQSQACGGQLAGPRAIFYDFLSGFPVLIPFPVLMQNIGGTAPAGDGSLWAFPVGWQPTIIPLKGIVLIRQDGQAFYKHSSEVTQLGFTVEQLFQAQVGRILQTFDLEGSQVQRICDSNRQGLVGPIPVNLVTRYYVAGPYTFIVYFRVTNTGTMSSVITKVAAGLTQEYDQLITGAFIPMEWVQFPGGGGQPECNDGRNNDPDQDQLIDFRMDPQCDGPNDTSERN